LKCKLSSARDELNEAKTLAEEQGDYIKELVSTKSRLNLEVSKLKTELLNSFRKAYAKAKSEILAEIGINKIRDFNEDDSPSGGMDFGHF
tara:strand:+ start:46 stop:315 length:270 start_codon:yes stop_codon:yes gene_type:complete